jgi:hypothetical protein
MVPPVGLIILMSDMLRLVGRRSVWCLDFRVVEGAVLSTCKVVFPLSIVSERPLEKNFG